jgi:hypothetical protein
MNRADTFVDFRSPIKPFLKGPSHKIETGLKLCCWIDLSWENSWWWFLKSSNAPWTFNKFYQKSSASEKRGGNCYVLADSCWEMLLKAVGQPLGNAHRLLESLRAILKGFKKCPNTRCQP